MRSRWDKVFTAIVLGTADHREGPRYTDDGWFDPKRFFFCGVPYLVNFTMCYSGFSDGSNTVVVTTGAELLVGH